jgi:hypothetical protein
MKRLSDADLLALSARDDVARPADGWSRQLLALVWPEQPAERWAVLDTARRDTLLLRLRCRQFGPVLQAQSACPACGERLEYELDGFQLAGPAEPAALLEAPTELALALDGRVLTLRRPSESDLAESGDPAPLMRRCLLDPPADADTLCADPAWQAAFGAALADELPLADPQIGLQCPACGAGWEESFDAGRFLRADLEAAAARLLDEVHQLALAYHWSERDILALPAARRREYLQRLAA